MKKSLLWILGSLILISFSTAAQIKIKETNSFKSEALSVAISYSKTTSIVFPYGIKSVDIGSQEVLVQKADGVENILLLKAAQQNFAQTNLTVVTTDGKLFGFILNYDEVSPLLNLVIESAMGLNQEIIFSSENENQKEIEQYAMLALSKNKRVSGLKAIDFGIGLKVTGLFIHQDVLYFRISIGNTSNISYEVDQLRFFIHDQKKSKRTASQEIELTPLLATSQDLRIPEESEVIAVFALPKFTIGDKKYLTLQLIEENGVRQIELNIKNNALKKLEILNSL